MPHEGSALHYRARGSGPALVLIHPGGYDSRMWTPLMACLSGTFTVIAIDRPGHGANVDELRVRRTNAPTTEEYRGLASQLRSEDTEHGETEQIEHLVSGLGHRRCSILGLGDGGMAALRLAAGGSLDVEDVILVDTQVTTTPGTTIETIMDRAADGPVDLVALSEIMTRVLETKDPTPAVEFLMEQQEDLSRVAPDDVALLRAMAMDNAVPALFTTAGQTPWSVDDPRSASIKCRVLALLATSGAAQNPVRLSQALPQAEVTVQDIDNARPFYPLTMAEDCCRRVRAHLAPSP